MTQVEYVPAGGAGAGGGGGGAGAGASATTTCVGALRLPACVVGQRAQLVADRRHLHAHPELAFAEAATARFVAAALRALPGVAVFEGVGRTGVVGLVRGGGGPGPCIALRADMDALPLPETADVAYRSQAAGVMHACGHDGHMAALLAAARVLAARAPALRGAVKLVFQPAEEGLGGAREMIAAGLLDDAPACGGLRVDAIYGIHLWSYLPLGVVSVTAGPFMAASDRFDITVRGRGGHGAHPQGTVDAIVEAAHLVMALQTVVSRSRDPLDAAVITCGSIHGGFGYNIIADEVKVSGTVRSFTAETQELLRTRMADICAGTARTYGGEIELDYKYGYPATCNSDAAAVSLVREVGAAVVGSDRASLECKTCGAEDFSYYLQPRPGAFFFVGAALPGEPRPHHSACGGCACDGECAHARARGACRSALPPPPTLPSRSQRLCLTLTRTRFLSARPCLSALSTACSAPSPPPFEEHVILTRTPSPHRKRRRGGGASSPSPSPSPSPSSPSAAAAPPTPSNSEAVPPTSPALLLPSSGGRMEPLAPASAAACAPSAVGGVGGAEK